jgi:hypothetical protein
MMSHFQNYQQGNPLSKNFDRVLAQLRQCQTATADEIVESIGTDRCIAITGRGTAPPI